MKKPNSKVLLIGLGIFFLGMIISGVTWAAWRDDDPTIENQYEQRNFTKINLHLAADLTVKQSNDEGVTIKAPESLMKNIKVSQNGGELTIESQNKWDWSFVGFGFWFNRSIDITVNVKDLEKISVSGSGDIKTDDQLIGDSLVIKVSGSGDIEMDLDYDKVTVDISGSGDVNLEGSIREQDIEIDGSGDVDTSDIESETVRLDISGSGDIKTWATGRLIIKVRGSGDIRYKGHPEITKDISGSGDVSSWN